MKRHIPGGLVAAILLAALTACGGGAEDDARGPQAASMSKAAAARETAPQALFEPSLATLTGDAALSGWQSLTLQGQVLEGGKVQARRRVTALLGEQVLASGFTDGLGRYSLALGLDRGAAGIVRVRVAEDATHPRSRMEVLLGGPATLAALGGRNASLNADSISALRIDELSTAESARIVNHHRSNTQQKDLRDEGAFRTALQGFTLDDGADLAAVSQLFLRREVAAPAGIATLWQLLTDEVGLRDFRAAARATKAALYDQLRIQARDGFYGRAAFRAGTLPQRMVLATMAAYEPTPLFQRAKGGEELRLDADGGGQLRGAQSFQAGHEQLQWLLNDKGGLELRGSGTEIATGINDHAERYHEHLVRLHRLSRTAYGDVLMSAWCGGTKPCSLDEAEGGLIEQPRLGLRVATAPTFDERSVPGHWFLPITGTSTTTAHYALGRLTDQPLQLLAGGRIVDSPLRWRVVDGDLLIEHSGIVPESWRLQVVQRSGAQRLVQVAYEGINGRSTVIAEAYERDESLALTRAALIGEWRIDRLVRSIALKADGVAQLRTHHSVFDGTWQLLPGGVVAMELGNGQGAMKLFWHVVADDGKLLTLVETGHLADAPDSRFSPLPYRYEKAPAQ